MKRCLLFIFAFTSSAIHSAGLEDPTGYAKNSSLQWNWALNALEKYPWVGCEKVLDIGCRDGKITALISEKYTNGLVIGLDISRPMISYASHFFSSGKNLLFQEGNISQCHFHGQFDLALSFCSLQFFVEQEEALRSIQESLRPGGKLLLVVPGKDATCLGPISEMLTKTEKWAPFFPSFKKQRVYFTQDEYLTLLGQAGFESIYFDVSDDALHFPHRAAFINWLKPIVNYISHLPTDLQEEFLRDVADVMLLSKTPTQDGSILLNSLLFECLCQKI